MARIESMLNKFWEAFIDGIPFLNLYDQGDYDIISRFGYNHLNENDNT